MADTPARLVHDADGLNGAGHPAELARHAETPLSQFFTRSHAPPPVIDAGAWRLEIDGLVRAPQSLTLEALRALPQRELPVTLLCAGLRRDELLHIAPLPGELPWGPEAASTGRWSGVSLADLLDAAGLDDDVRHVEFTGLDRVERHGTRFGFGGSIAVEKARDRDVLVALTLNGAPLTPTHGFPARTIVPGWIGARSVKWLGRITAARTPSTNYFQARAYRVLREPVPGSPMDVSTGTALSEVSLNAVILDPAPSQPQHPGAHVVRGWAIGAGGVPITAVEFSADDGATWQAVQLDAQRARWTWTRWVAEVTLAPGRHVLVVRARDESGASQPADVRDAWNVKGYSNNAWHRVPVVVG